MKKILLILLVLSLSGCADHVTFTQATTVAPVGFWYGLWHGLIAPISWIISLFSDNVAIYAIYNNGGWYDFGFKGSFRDQNNIKSNQSTIKQFNHLSYTNLIH